MDTSGDGLLQCLQKLSDEEFQRFKELLRKEPEKFKLKPISWTKIENTSKEDLVMQLNTRYPGKAWDMVVSLFLQVSREDLSAMAHKERRYKQTKYKEFMKNTFQHIWTLETKTHIPDGCYDIIIEHQYRALHGIFDYESEPVTAVVSGCRGGKLSLAVLISNKLPESSETYDILSDPKRILFILDGFDYLKFDLQLRTNLCNDWRKRLPTQIVLSSLLQKIMLPECSLLLELGNSSISKIIPLLQYPREIIIPGFSEKIIKFYCMSFFKTHTGIEVFENLKSIEPLFTLCRSPYLCWMICSSLKWRDVVKRFGQTVAFVYTVFMLSAFKSTYARNPSKQNRAQLKTLCTLTVEGMWKQVSVFDSGDLRRNGIANSEKAVWLRMKSFQKQGNNVVFYHSTLQWYFATLFYFLKQDKDTHHPVIGSLPQLLGEIYAHKQNQWFQTRILLFGMATEQVASLLEPCFGFVSTKEVRQEIIRYIKSLSQEEYNDKLVHPWDLFFCILDNQEERFVRQVMDRFEEITVNISDVDDLSATQYSLQCAPKLKNLHLHIQKSIFSEIHDPEYGDLETFKLDKKIVAIHWTMLCNILRNLHMLDLNSCHFNKKATQDLCNSMSLSPTVPLTVFNLHSLLWSFITNIGDGSLFHTLLHLPHLKYLNLYGTNLSNDVVKMLCSALKCSTCKVEELLLGKGDISSEACDIIATSIINSKVKHLSLVENPLKNKGVISLCEMLKDPSCALESLM